MRANIFHDFLRMELWALHGQAISRFSRFQAVSPHRLVGRTAFGKTRDMKIQGRELGILVFIYILQVNVLVYIYIYI